jgi:hypothetical protein
VKHFKRALPLLMVGALVATIGVSGVAAQEKWDITKVKVKDQPVKKVDKLVAKEGQTGYGLQKIDLKPVKKLDKAQNAKANAQTIGTEAVDNHTPGTAIYLDTNTVYSDTITAEGQENWYYVYVPEAGKLTLFLQTPQDPNIDYDLALFHLNESTMMLENGVGSQYGPGMFEQVSQVVQPGYYFFRINSYQGFDAENPYYFIAQFSNTNDSAEPDDNIWQAKPYVQSINVNQTLDNVYDQDWFLYTANDDTLVSLNFDASGATNDVTLDIFDTSFNGIGTLMEKPSKQMFRLPKGTYYMRVSSPSGAVDSYTMNLDGSLKGTWVNEVSSIYKHVPNYLLYTTTANELKVNGKTVPFKWERKYYFSWGGGYSQRTQSVSYGLGNMYGDIEFGSYSATYYGYIPNVFRFKVSQVSYMHHRSYYQSGIPPIYESDFSDVTGRVTPRTTDYIDDLAPELGPLHLIVNADTGEVVDFDAGLNFYYFKPNWYDPSIETRSFTKKY